MADGREQNKGGSLPAVRRIIRKLNKKRLKKLDENDIIFRETLTPAPAAVPGTMVRGSIDMWFMLLVLILIAFGAVMSYSASSVYAETYYGNSTHFLWKYILYAVISIVGTLPFIIFARPWFWRLFGVCSYAASVMLLLLVLLIGQEGGGAQRWIVIGPMTLQPSEVAKMAVVLTLALFLSKYEKQVTSDQKFGGSFRYGVIAPAAIFGFICALVALEKHISGLMIIGMIGIAVMFMGGTRLRYILLIIGGIAAAGCLLILVSDYAQERVFTWLHLDEADPFLRLNQCFHVSPLPAPVRHERGQHFRGPGDIFQRDIFFPRVGHLQAAGPIDYRRNTELVVVEPGVAGSRHAARFQDEAGERPRAHQRARQRV
jgi:hypothetical protein